MSRYAKYAAFLVLGVIALLLWWAYLAGDRLQDGSSPSFTPDESQALTASVAGEEAQQSSAAEPLAKTDQSEKSADTEAEDSSKQTDKDRQTDVDSDEEPSATETVNSVLKSRDLEQAFLAFRSIQQCRHAPITDQDLQHHLTKIERLRNDPEHGWELSQHLQGAEERKLVLLEECRALMRLRDQIWASELFDRAASGDEFARFIYAMWAPRQRTTLETSTEQLLAYESMALEFTMQNLEEGHPLGLLAFGLSYQQGQYFTPSRHVLGNAYLVAAELCSNGQFGLQGMLDSLLASMEEHQFGASPVSTEEVLVAGTRLHDAHCATSITNSPP